MSKALNCAKCLPKFNVHQKRKFVRGNTRIGPVLEVKVTNHLERYGIEIKIGSMEKDGSQYWIVISRRVRKYVTELLQENKNLVQCEEVPRDEREGTVHTVFIFIFVNFLKDQSTEMERHIRRWKD